MHIYPMYSAALMHASSYGHKMRIQGIHINELNEYCQCFTLCFYLIPLVMCMRRSFVHFHIFSNALFIVDIVVTSMQIRRYAVSWLHVYIMQYNVQADASEEHCFFASHHPVCVDGTFPNFIT